MCDNFIPLAFRKYCRYGTYPYPIPNPPPHELPKRCCSSSSSCSSSCSSSSSSSSSSETCCVTSSKKCCTSPKKCCNKKSKECCQKTTYEITECCKTTKLTDSFNINRFTYSTSGTIDKPFVITLVNKKGHPWENKITDTSMCFAIDGIKGKSLYLKKNMTYYFIYQVSSNSKNVDHFYFTQDPRGGPDDVLYLSKKLYDTPMFDKICLKITDNFPTIIYYQSKNHKYIGGSIFIINQL